MLESLRVRGYRSLLDLKVKPGPVTIVTGGNGVGKSNLYRSLLLLHRMAEGRFAEAVAAEGGMPSILWAGERFGGAAPAIHWDVACGSFEFSLSCGLSPADAFSAFKTDPDIKEETIHGSGKSRLIARRKGPMLSLRGASGKMETLPLPFHGPESMIQEVRDGTAHPAVVAARETFLSWRFYHQFRTDVDSPIRRPQIGFWSPVLAHDGANLAPALQTICESGGAESLRETIDSAFPGTEWQTTTENGLFELQLNSPGLLRPMRAAEISDGTLRFFCLCAALLSPLRPPLLVLNEPETSLHETMIAPLADLIARTPDDAQIIVVTHSRKLARLVAQKRDTHTIELVSIDGQTRLAQDASGRRAWSF